jgi:hypothetical protein
MNRGRHKKSKGKEFNTQAEILDTIQEKLRVLLLIYKNQSSYSTKDFYAKAWISSNDGRDYYEITAWYINNIYYLNNFIDRVKIELDRATIKNKIYLIKFNFGGNSKTFKYKHE